MSAPQPGNGHDTAPSLAHLRVLSALVDRIDLARHHGFQFSGDRDLYKALGYKWPVSLQDYRDRYRRGGIAKRIVDAKPQATWRDPPEVVEDEDTQRATRFESAFARLCHRCALWHYLERVDKLAGIGHYAVLLVGLRDGRPLEQPVGSVRGPEDVLYLAPYLEENAAIDRLVEDSQDERFGLPLLYSIRVGAAELTGGIRSTRLRRKAKRLVHWSRVLHVAEGLGEDEVIGTPRLEACWNLLDDLFKVSGGAGEMFWRGGYGGLQADVQKDFALSDKERDDLEDQFDQFVHNMRRILQTRGVTLNPLQFNIASPQGAFMMLRALISGATEIPQRILFGSEQGQLASEQDRHNWNERIHERRTSFGERTLRSLVTLLQRPGALPPNRRGSDWEARWPDLMALSERERAEVADIEARGAQRLANARQFSEVAITEGEYRERIGLPRTRPEGEDDQLPADGG